jgi:hypothetical protein
VDVCSEVGGDATLGDATGDCDVTLAVADGTGVSARFNGDQRGEEQRGHRIDCHRPVASLVKAIAHTLRRPMI